VILDAATAFDTNGFANPMAGRIGWSLDAGGHSLSLAYGPAAGRRLADQIKSLLP
jgi:hypothetical protein